MSFSFLEKIYILIDDLNHWLWGNVKTWGWVTATLATLGASFSIACFLGFGSSLVYSFFFKIHEKETSQLCFKKKKKKKKQLWLSFTSTFLLAVSGVNFWFGFGFSSLFWKKINLKESWEKKEKKLIEIEIDRNRNW